MKHRSLAGLFALIFALAMLGGCTSTTTVNGVVDKPVDKEKALDNRLQLALGYLSRGDREGARDHLEKAMDINSRSPEVHDVWALLYQQEGEWGEAEDHYRKALSYDSNFTRGRNNYGMFLLRQGRYEEAYQQFLTGSKDLDYPKRGELFYKLGVTAIKLNKPAEAEQALNKAVVLDPQLSQSYLELAELAFNGTDYQRAKAMLDKYNESRQRPTPRGLWLGVRLEHQLGDKDAEASQGLALRNLFPDSRENQEYQNWLNNEKKR